MNYLVHLERMITCCWLFL